MFVLAKHTVPKKNRIPMICKHESCGSGYSEQIMLQKPSRVLNKPTRCTSYFQVSYSILGHAMGYAVFRLQVVSGID